MFGLDTLVDKIMSMADEDHEFANLWEVKNIRFDVDPDEEKKKIQKPIAISHNIQDIKGNPGTKGTLTLTNLRATWELNNDRFTNLSFGLDTILSVMIKELPSYNSGQKYNLIVKTENLSRTRYEFKFMGFSESDQSLFFKLSELHKQAVESKSYRTTTLSLKCDPQFVPLEQEEIKSIFSNFFFFENDEQNASTIILTNVRLIVIRKNIKAINYGIPWIMIKSFEMVEMGNKQGIRMICRGYLFKKSLHIQAAKGDEIKKFYQQLKSFCETYNKAPILGLESKKQEQLQPIPKRLEQDFIEIQATKVNIHKRKNAYATGKTKGFLQDAEFNEELGLMMQKLPQGVTRQSLWELRRD